MLGTLATVACKLKETGKFSYKPTTIARKGAIGYNKGSNWA
jgi:hypothetical protein